MPEYPEKLQALLDVFAGVTDTHERTQLLLDYAKRFKEVPPEVATRPFAKDHLVPHCESEAYVWAAPNADGTLKLHFAVENPSGVSAKALGAPCCRRRSRGSRGRNRQGRPRDRRAAVPAEHLDGQGHGPDVDGGGGAGAGQAPACLIGSSGRARLPGPRSAGAGIAVRHATSHGDRTLAPPPVYCPPCDPPSRCSSMAAVVFALTAPSGAGAARRLTVTSPTLAAGQPIPKQHTADGENISPALAWTGAPATTRSFALICDDPDVPMPRPFVHWVIYNIPATAKGLPENIPIDPAAAMPAEIAGAVQGLSGFRRPIYRGPAPPPGKPHHYHFTVYALDVAGLAPGLTKAQLVEAMPGTSSARASSSRPTSASHRLRRRTVSRTPWPTLRSPAAIC